MYIELKNINKSFGDFQASKDVNFAIEKGKLVGLLAREELDSYFRITHYFLILRYMTTSLMG